MTSNFIISHFHSLSYKLIIGFFIIVFFKCFSVSYAHSEDSNKTERLNMKLLFAVIDNNSNAIMRLINDGADVNMRDSFGNTLLHYAMYKKAVEALIKAGVDVDARNIFGNTPLHYNSQGHNSSMQYEKVSILIDAGADVNIRNNNGKTPLDYDNHVAARNALLRTGALTSNELLQREGEVELNFELLIAVIEMDIETVVKLLANAPNVNMRDHFGNTLLHYVVQLAHQLNSHNMKRHNKLVEILIAAGVDINARNKAGKTPIDMNTEYNSNLLREAGALTSDEVVQQELNFNLLLAVTYNDIEATRHLVNNGANVMIKDRFGNTLLHYSKTAVIISTLIQEGVGINTKNNFGETPLHINSSQGQNYSTEDEKTKKVLALIEAGAKVNVRNKEGKTPLDYKHSIKAQNALIKAGAIMSSLCIYVLL